MTTNDLEFIRRKDDRVVIIARTKQGMAWCMQNLIIDEYDSGHEVLSVRADTLEIEEFVRMIREADLNVEVI